MHPPLEVRQHPHCKEVRRASRARQPATQHACPACPINATRFGGHYCTAGLPADPLLPVGRRTLHIPASSQYILALKQCHAGHPVAKFWGVCNDAAKALNVCLQEEKAEKR